MNKKINIWQIKNMVTLSLLGSVNVFSMQLVQQQYSIFALPRELMHAELAQSNIVSHLDLQSRSRLKRTCQHYNKECNVDHVCPLFFKNPCGTYVCQTLTNNYDACTKALVHCAATSNKQMFNHLFNHHGVVRNDDVYRMFKNYSSGVLEDHMKIYAKHYASKEKRQKRTFKCLVRGLLEQDAAAVKTVLQGNDLDVFSVAVKYEKNAFLKGLAIPKKYSLNAIFYNACLFNDTDLLQLLLDGMAEKNKNRLLCLVVRYSTSNMISQLIARKTLSVDMADPSGRTMLHYASSCNKDVLIQVLFKHGARVNYTDAWGSTPLHYASHCVSVNAVIELLKAPDADARIKNDAKETALCYVSSFNRILTGNGYEKRQQKQIKSLLKNHIVSKSGNSVFYKKSNGDKYSLLD